MKNKINVLSVQSSKRNNLLNVFVNYWLVGLFDNRIDLTSCNILIVRK